MSPVLGQRACSPHHGGRPRILVYSNSSGEGRFTIQFASTILVIFAAIACASPISSFIAAQGWMMPILGTRARVPRIMVDDLFMRIVVI
jgi:hypothetical protein